MFNKFAMFLVAAMSLSGITRAQAPCGTDEQYHKLLEKYPQLAQYEAQFNAQLASGANMRTTAVSDTITYDVPVVIHVIHDYENEYIPDNTIFNAFAYWADVFMKRNPDTVNVIPPFKPYIGNPKMRLRLATIDPNGKPTKGIVHQQSYLAKVADDQAKYNSWPNNKYINIWFIGSFGGGSAAAYAYYPSSGASLPFYDGVICRYDYINVEKTIPHELGHVLNLPHVWGSTNSAGVACGDDGVDDTPPTMGHTPGCTDAKVYDGTCAAGYSKTYISMSGLPDSVVNYPDTTNAQNIMDYTYCEIMFSKGQCVRMRNALTSPVAGRNNLITPANLEATGALAPRPDLKPTADFTMYKAVNVGSITDKRTYFLAVNSPGKFWFRNTSWNDTISGVQWNFSNGATTPVSTDVYGVHNQFSVPGWVTVSLIASSNAGNDTLTNTHAVYVADTAPAGGMGYSQQFENAATTANWPMFNYYNNQFKWDLYEGAGYGDNSCLRYRSFDTSDRIFGTPVGDYDDIITPSFNLSGITDSLYLNFYTAGAYTSGSGGWTPNVGDMLQVEVSITGGARWNKIAEYSGTSLTNNGYRATEFLPATTALWKPRAVSVPAAYRTGNTYFRFRYKPGNTGNNLYLDNFYIYPYPTGVKEAMAVEGASFKVFPNPSSDGCNIAFTAGNDGSVYYCIKDLAGKTVCERTKSYTPNSMQQEVIPRSATPVAGMYFITMVIDGVQTTQKLVVY